MVSLSSFTTGEVVVPGVIEKYLLGNEVHASQIGLEIFVLHDLMSRSVNHSCDPNCGIQVNISGAHDLVAIREIIAGEEIVVDYAMGNYTVEHFSGDCLCGSDLCRGRITGWKDLSAALKEKYRKFTASYLLLIPG